MRTELSWKVKPKDADFEFTYSRGLKCNNVNHESPMIVKWRSEMVRSRERKEQEENQTRNRWTCKYTSLCVSIYMEGNTLTKRAFSILWSPSKSRRDDFAPVSAAHFLFSIKINVACACGAFFRGIWKFRSLAVSESLLIDATRGSYGLMTKGSAIDSEWTEESCSLFSREEWFHFYGHRR